MIHRCPMRRPLILAAGLALLLSGCQGEQMNVAVAPTGSPAAPTVLPEPAPSSAMPTLPDVVPAPVGELAAGTLLWPDHLNADEAEPYFVIEPITDEIFERINGYSWREGAIPISELRYLRLLYWGFEDEISAAVDFASGGVEPGTHVGEIIVNVAIADDVLSIFKELYAAEYQIGLMVLIDNFDADDTASMTANNTSGFNHRYIAGTRTLSNHSRGLAIDLNPIQNPWVSGNNVEPEIGRPFKDRADIRPGMITHDDLAFQLFKQHGFTWGGDWRTPKDYQHFEKSL